MSGADTAATRNTCGVAARWPLSAALAVTLAGGALAQEPAPRADAAAPAETREPTRDKTPAKAVTITSGHRISNVLPVPRPADLGGAAVTIVPPSPAPKAGFFANLFDAPAAPAAPSPGILAYAPATGLAAPAPAPADGGGIRALVSRHARHHGLPDSLAHRIVMRESRYNPRATARGYYGLMQISLPTARQMGYRGAPAGLLDAETNLTYAMPYLANAWIASGANEARAVSLYARGYYYEAKRKGLLGQLRTAGSPPRAQASVQP